MPVALLSGVDSQFLPTVSILFVGTVAPLSAHALTLEVPPSTRARRTLTLAPTTRRAGGQGAGGDLNSAVGVQPGTIGTTARGGRAGAVTPVRNLAGTARDVTRAAGVGAPSAVDDRCRRWRSGSSSDRRAVGQGAGRELNGAVGVQPGTIGTTARGGRAGALARMPYFAGAARDVTRAAGVGAPSAVDDSCRRWRAFFPGVSCARAGVAAAVGHG